MFKIKRYTFLLFLFSYTYVSSQATIYVSRIARGNYDGTSWGNAYNNLQPALDAAVAGDQVWVAKGTYIPTESPNGITTNKRDFSFHFKKNIKLYGGFGGTETAVSQRIASNITILNGDLGTSEKAHHVIITRSLSSSSVINGFTIKNGRADKSEVFDEENNRWPGVTYVDEIFSRSQGGGIYNIGSAPTITKVIFIDNYAYWGAGLSTDSAATTTINKSIFKDNTAWQGAGGISSGSTLIINNSIFENNSGPWGGGICMSSSGGSVIINNGTFKGNTSSNGPAVCLFVNCDAYIYNTVFWNNKQGGNIKDIYKTPSSILTGNNNASDANKAPATTGALITLTTNPFVNSTDTNGADNIYGTSDDGLMPGENSPLINAGDNSKNIKNFDIASSPRVFNNTIDIGAYENIYSSFIYVDINATGNNNGGSWANAYTKLQTALDRITTNGQIWVAKGTYMPTESPDENTKTETRTVAFHFSKDIELYGGFAATETSITDRVAGNSTILSGDIGVLNNHSDNAHHVITTINLSNNTIIDGFTITDGNANGTGDYLTYEENTFIRKFGGGISNRNSSPSINNVIFTNNKAFDGGAIYNFDSSPNTNNVIFTNNTATNSGGAIFNYNSSTSIINTTFVNNTAANLGAAIRNTASSSSAIYNTVFWNNLENGSINDIRKETNNITGNNNASDANKAPATTGTLITLSTNPFVDSTDANGTDNIYGTKDDGLIPKEDSPLIDAGDTTKNTKTLDIAFAPRVFNSTIDIGAHENLLSAFIYVDINATGDSNGTSWTNAYPKLQTALNRITTNGQIWVAKGTYMPTESPDENTTETRTVAFHFSKDIALYGGFTGTETSITDRVAGNPTILSGDIGVLNNDSDNAHHVIITRNLSNSTIIDGFTVTDGNANGTGGSIYYEGKNFNKTHGAGMNNSDSSPSINNVIFANNKAFLGGAMYNENSSSSINNVVFTNNKASYGGAMYNSASSPSVINTTFTNNTADEKGAGIRNSSTSNPAIYNTIFWNNKENGFMNDIRNYSNILTGNNNASDGPNAPATTGALITLTTDPFVNSTDPNGADGIFGTSDDGLIPTATSLIYNEGDNTKNNKLLDIAGKSRIFNTTIDIGAYESQIDLAPYITSIIRQNPNTYQTELDTLIWAITFSEPINNLDATDFTISGTTASVFAIINSSGNTYEITISGGDLGTLEGTVTLNFSATQDIKDLGGNSLTNLTPTGTNNNTFTVTNPPVSLSISLASGIEELTTVIIVTATKPTAVVGNQTVDIDVTGTGITTSDYTLSSTTITILDGATTGTVTFTVLNDAITEGSETAILTISNPSSGIVLGTTITQNITIIESRPFITTWTTTVAGENITIPTTGSGYDYAIDWGDGIIEYNQAGNTTHTYAVAETQTISIYGDFPSIYFNEEGDKDIIQTIEQWGDIEWTSMLKAFNGCSNLNITNTNIDTPNLSNVTGMRDMFRNATAFNGDLSSWDTSNVRNMRFMFCSATSFNSDLSSWDTSNATNMNSMFKEASKFNQDLSSWDLSSITSLVDMFYNSDINETNYDNILIGWNANVNTPNDLDLGIVPATYCTAEAAKFNLTTVSGEKGWTIDDDGPCDALATTNIQEAATETLSMYPNPANNFITIKIDQAYTINKIQIFNTLGNAVYTHKYTETIDIRNLHTGVYIMEIHFENSVKTIRFIKN